MKKNFTSSNFLITQTGQNTLGLINNISLLFKRGSSLFIIAAFILLVAIFSAFTTRPFVEKEVSAYLQLPLEERTISNYFANPAQRESLTIALTEVYSTSNYELLWLKDEKSAAKLESLIVALQEATKEGLNPATYHLDQIIKLKSEEGLFSDAARVAELDRLATASYLLYASHLYNGSLTPSQLDANWHIKPKNVQLAQLLQNAILNNKIKQSLTDLTNVNPAYALLKRELASLKAVAQKGGWLTIADNSGLQKNMSGEAVEMLKKRLIISGDLDSTYNNGNLFDQTVAVAVQKFQSRHGLPVNGKVDERTLAALNTPVGARIQQVALNLERMRWLPRQTSKTLISVNIPDFKLQVLEQNKLVLEARVVVGKTEFATPVFEDSLETIVFSPEWNVPNQIATEEILPRVQENPGYLKKNNFEVYDSYSANAKPINPYKVNWEEVNVEKFKYRFVQKANEKNSLGAVKFLFPNPLNIYIHDTPAKGLFKENTRAYSHGCIRLENPAKLAASLLKKDANWNETKIQEKMHQTESTKVNLTQAVKVQIMYLTAFVQDGKLQFRDDVYGYDQSQINTLRN